MSEIPPSHEFTKAGSIPVMRWPLLDATRVVETVVTTRGGGVSTGVYESLNLGLHVGDDPAAVIENRSRAAGAIGLGLDDLVFCKQSHGRAVEHVGVADRGRGTRSDLDAIADTDAMVTTDAGVGLVIMVADCVPIVLVDPVSRVLACVHAGWRGTTQRVVTETVDRMVDLGAKRSRLLVGVGPAIPADRYQVGDDVSVAASECFGREVGMVLQADGTGRWLFDTWKANLLVLRDSGVLADNVALAALSTGEGRFFSDREARPCGRFAALAKLNH